MASVRLENRALIAVSGPDAEHFLNNLVTTDLSGMTNREWRPGALLTAQGKVQFNFLIAREGDHFLMETWLADSAELHKRLKFYRLRAKVDLSAPVEKPVWVTWDDPSPPASRRDMRFGAHPVWRNFAADGNNPTGHAVWDALRIRFGIAEPHTDYAYGDVFPHDINLDQIGGVSFKKGCYVGQEVVSRMQHRSTARWRVMVASSAQALTPGAKVIAGGKPAGHIGTVSGNQGLALVRLDRIKDARGSGAPVVAGEAPLTVEFPENVTFSWPETAVEG